MTPLHPPITEFTLKVIDRYLQEQVPVLVEQQLQRVVPGWAEPCSSHSVPGSGTVWLPEYSRWLDERLAQHWTRSLEPKIQEAVLATLDQILEPLLVQLTEALTPKIEMLIKSALTQVVTLR